MYVLGIETSCDETSAAIADEKSVISNIISTQAIHEEYGGVVPEFASRAHIKQLIPIIKMAMSTAQLTFEDLDGLAVTYGPGLAGSLLVGLCVTKSLSLSLDIPYIGINHIEGHIAAVDAHSDQAEYPFIALVASGGHTLLVYVEKELTYKIIGQTIDDASGEAFDKVAKVLGLGYPGGPIIEKMAKNGNEHAIQFPRALMEKYNLNFSFSGLKTSVLYYVQAQKREKQKINVEDVAASFQAAVVDVLVKKAFRAMKIYKCTNLVLAGGVIRNNRLRKTFEKKCKQNDINLKIPSPELCTDNAAMIARAGLRRLRRGEKSLLNLEVAPNLSFSDNQ